MSSHRSGPLTMTAAAVVAGRAVHRPGWITVEDGLVVAVGTGGAPSREATAGVSIIDFGDAVVVPGFVDMHVHGGGGGAFTSADPTEVERAVTTHRSHGTTAMCASLVSAQPEPLAEQVARLASFVELGDLLGIHLEGPWLAPKRLGAHDPSSLRAPDPHEIRRLLDAARGTIRMVTIAPELPGALDAIALLREHGVVAAVGHTDATYDQTREAIRAGATVGTHLFNAMRPIKHREPGPVVALMEDPNVVVELIADGVHVHQAMLDQVRHWVGPERVALVTDAMAATGMPDGLYQLGTLDVTVADGVARLTGGNTIAGGTCTTDVLFRAAAGHPQQLDDLRLLEAVQMTSAVPLRALGLGHQDLSVGTPADLVVLSPDLQVTTVLSQGEWVNDGRVTRAP